MKPAIFKTVILALATILITACGSDDEPVTPMLNDEAVINTLNFTTQQNTNLYKNVTAEIDEASKTITATVWVILPTAQLNTEISLIPEITFTDSATIEPANNEAILAGGNNSSPVNYIVTAEDGETTQNYTLTTTVKYINATAKDVVDIDDLVTLYAFKDANPNATDVITNWDLDNTDVSSIETSLTNNGVTLNSSKKIDILVISRANVANIPSEIKNLTEMTELDLFRNGITSLPEEIGALTALERLRLNNNNLTALPDSFSQLESLDFLMLSTNQFTNIPSEVIQLPALTSLNISRNSINEITAEIANLTTLESLRINHNAIQSIASEIGNLSNLTFLDIAYNQINELPAEISNLTNLDALNARYNNIQSLPPEIGNSNIRILYLNDNNITPNGLPDEMANMSSLVWIRLFNNPELDANATISTTICNFLKNIQNNGGTVQTDLDLSGC